MEQEQRLKRYFYFLLQIGLTHFCFIMWVLNCEYLSYRNSDSLWIPNGWMWQQQIPSFPPCFLHVSLWYTIRKNAVTLWCFCPGHLLELFVKVVWQPMIIFLISEKHSLSSCKFIPMSVFVSTNFTHPCLKMLKLRCLYFLSRVTGARNGNFFTGEKAYNTYFTLSSKCRLVHC